MITVASYQGRTIVGRLERGADIIEGLRAVCGTREVRCGTVSAVGALESVELIHYDPKRKRYRPPRLLKGPLEILSLQGNLSENEGDLHAHLHVTLSREGDNGIEVMGGHLAAGKVFACEFCITALDDVLLRRGEDRFTGLRLWQTGFEADPPQAAGSAEPGIPASGVGAVEAAEKEPDRPVEGDPERVPRDEAREEAEDDAEDDAAEPHLPRPGATGTTSWADVAKASERAQEPDPIAAWAGAAARGAEPGEAGAAAAAPPQDEQEEEEELEDYVELEAGDIIEHPKFGRCVVERLEGAEEYVHVRLRNRNVVRLSLDIVTLELIGAEAGQQVFRARIEP